MNILPVRKTRSLSRRLTAIRTDVAKLSGDVRGLFEDVADIVSTGAGPIVRPVASTVTMVSARLNGNRPNRIIQLGSRGRQVAAVVASVGTAAVVGGLLAARQGVFSNGRSFLSA